MGSSVSAWLVAQCTKGGDSILAPFCSLKAFSLLQNTIAERVIKVTKRRDWACMGNFQEVRLDTLSPVLPEHTQSNEGASFYSYKHEYHMESVDAILSRWD